MAPPFFVPIKTCYDNYMRHVLEKHPAREVMDYKTFFRERQEARFGGKGGFRCC